MNRLIQFGRTRPALLGLQCLVLMLVVLTGALNASRMPFLLGEPFRAEFADASGLQAGEEVRVAGVTVGTVRDIEVEDDVVVVSFDVDDDVELGHRTSASIEVKTLLGQHYLGLDPAGSEELEDSIVPLERTTTPLNVVPAFAELTETAGGIDAEQLSSSFDALAGVLEQSAPEVRRTLDGLGRLSRSISTRDEQVQQLFDDAEGVSGVLAARNDDVSALIGASDQVLATLDSRREVISRIITETTALARQLRGLVADNRAVVGPALDKLNRVLAVLERNRDNIDEALRATALYGREFTSVGGTGRFFDGSVTLPRAYALCNNSSDSVLADVLDPVLSALNQQVNGEDSPCLPVGPAAGGRR